MHEDFVIEITADHRGDYFGQVVASPRGPSPLFPLALPWDAVTLEATLQDWENAVCRDLYEERPEAKALAREEIEEQREKLAGKLADLLFSSFARGKLRASLSRLDLKRAQGWPLVLRVVLRDPRVPGDPKPEVGAVLGLPWELLQEPGGSVFLSRGMRTTVVRSLGPLETVPPPPLPHPLRVLLVASSPQGLTQLDLDREMENVRSAIDAVNQLGVVELDAFQGGAVEDVRQAILKERFHVIHFMGHGSDAGEARGIYLENPDGSPRFVPGEELAAMLALGLPELRLVLLNACRTGFGLTKDLLRAGIPAVVAMQGSISDEMANDFSTSFYEDLTAGFPVDISVGLWREAASDYSPEWATPVVFSNTREARLFESSPISVEAGKRIHLAVRSRLDKNDQHTPAWGKVSERQADRLLSLSSSFDEKNKIRRKSLWERRVLPKLQSFLADAAGDQPPLLLEMAAHQSLAFAAGYYLEIKSGFDIRLRQRGGRGHEDWRLDEGLVPEGPLWQELEPPQQIGDGPDLGVAIEIARPVLGDVLAWLATPPVDPTEPRPKIGKLLRATIHPTPGQITILSGAHAFALAEKLEPWIRARSAVNPGRTLHLFASAPNSFLFYLGQLARNLGKIQLYEYAFGNPAGERYSRSLRLPPEGYAPVRPPR